MIRNGHILSIATILCILIAEGCTVGTKPITQAYDPDATIKLSDTFKSLKAPAAGRSN